MKRKQVAKFSASLSLFAILVGMCVTLPAVKASADPIQPDECFPAVLMLRGSGEEQVKQLGSPSDVVYYPEGSTAQSALVVTDGNEGETLKRALDSFMEMPDIAQSASRLRFIGIDYPAEAVEPIYEGIQMPKTMGLPTGESEAMALSFSIQTLLHTAKYTDSINQGATAVTDFIEADESRNCNTQYILMGYSQGALSARVAMNLEDNNTDKIIGSYFLGDPFQKANATSTDQRSVANTGHHRNGVLRQGLETLTAAANLGMGFIAPVGLGTLLENFSGNLAKSDQTVYGNTAGGSVVSRSLCHKSDWICATDLADADTGQHSNYFFSETATPGQPLPPGSVDIEHETPGLDSQLKALADSQPGNPRERVLTTTTGVSVVGSPTVYNVANARPDDLCSWDEGSDGSFEAVSIPCATYEVMHTGTDAKISVKVVDSFGIEHLDSMENDVLDPEVVANLASVPYDQWLRFESYVDPKECVTIPNDWQFEFDGNVGSETGFKVLPCIDNYTSDLNHSPSQVFKKTAALTDDDLPTDHYLSGYDERLKINANNQSGTSTTNGVEVHPTTQESQYWNDGNTGAKVELAQVIDGVAYYQLKVFWYGLSGCAAHSTGPDSYSLKICDLSDEDQLFKAVLSEGNYGDFTIENDHTPPSPVTNFRITGTDGAYFDVAWDQAMDNRGPHIRYYQLESYDEYNDEWYELEVVVGESTSTQVYSYDLSSKIRISAVDHNYNRSPWTELTL